MARLATGGLIDRSRPLSFRFNGESLNGYAGDTLASALIANGLKRIGRSFKYHRPRGVLTAGSEEPNALVTLGAGAQAEPNTRATVVDLHDGLEAYSQNHWPSLDHDLLAINQLISPFLPAGFYYKTFMWPGFLWERVYEPFIRRAAGLGALSGAPDPDLYDRTHAFCDLLVVGGGPAGLAAALTASRAGLRVVVADEDSMLGGRLLADQRAIDGAPGHEWAREAEAELRAAGNVSVLTRTAIAGVFDGGAYIAVETLHDHAAKQRLWKVTAKRALLAAGAIERPIVFGGNDKPGVMMASALTTYLNRFAAAPGEAIAVFTTTDSGWRSAEAAMRAGLRLVAVIDPRTDPAIPHAVQSSGARLLRGGAVTDVRGGDTLQLDVRTQAGQSLRLDVDALAVSGGWTPTIALAANLGGKPQWSEALQAFLAHAPPSGMEIIGAAAGAYALRDCLTQGAAAAARIAGDFGRGAAAPEYRTDGDHIRATPFWRVAGAKTKAFVDFQNDVTDTDIELAAREGFTSPEHMKRYTTLGMATDQGKTSQLNGHAILAEATGRSIAETGVILARAPYTPVSIGVLAGHHRGAHFRPERHTTSHEWAAARGAPFVDAGLWKRAQYFPQAGDRDWLDAVIREVTNTRTRVGICDVSTLGKIDVRGPDAGVLLDRLYINTFSNLPVGRARYGVMLREDGFVFDDGTVTRFAADHFFVTTTTANAARVMQHIDFCRQVLWPQLDVQAVSVTERWATYALAGPRARALVSRILPDVDVSNAALPYMGALDTRWRDHPARLFRLSFSGELGYELAVPAHLGGALIEELMTEGTELGAAPYGVEALSVMRIEKGHPAGGELNGQTTAGDLGLGRLMSRKKDFIGRVLSQRPALVDPQRLALVGVKPLERADRIRAGAHIINQGAAGAATDDQGHITAAAYSPSLESWIGLALVKGGRTRHGERMMFHDPVRGGRFEIELCDPVFIDPTGARLRG